MTSEIDHQPVQVHVMPVNDLRPHDESLQCWCRPVDDAGVVVHNSMDGREDFEEGRRLPS